MGCLSSLGSQRNRSLGDKFRGLARDKLPAAHCLRVQDAYACEERGWGRKKRKIALAAPQRESSRWLLCLEAFISFLQVGILEIWEHGGVSAKYSSGVAF